MIIQCSCGQQIHVTPPDNTAIKVVCPNCGKETFLSAKDVTRGNKAEKNMEKKQAVTSEYTVCKNIKTYRIISSILWIVIGIVQICFVYTAAIGIWNIINAVITLSTTKNVFPHNDALIAAYEGQKIWLIVAAIVNLLFGGAVGVIIVGTDWICRNYVLKNRWVFEQESTSCEQTPQNYCSNCGVKLDSNSIYCNHCGTKINGKL